MSDFSNIYDLTIKMYIYIYKFTFSVSGYSGDDALKKLE